MKGPPPNIWVVPNEFGHLVVKPYKKNLPLSATSYIRADVYINALERFDSLSNLVVEKDAEIERLRSALKMELAYSGGAE